MKCSVEQQDREGDRHTHVLVLPDGRPGMEVQLDVGTDDMQDCKKTKGAD